MPQESAGGAASAGPHGGTTARIVRESDMMRAGFEGRLLELTAASVLLRVGVAIESNERIKITLKNLVQRIQKELRGTIRRAATADDGSTTLDIELLTRLTPLEVSLLKMGIAREEDAGPKWV